ncbi:MAG TPA: diguanylate cyclase, partial [Candidatus Eremiobacteraceae bacterium]|nr:diguanylate cyclase [Candidatus Eremiobacteraceae bacterium]
MELDRELLRRSSELLLADLPLDQLFERFCRLLSEFIRLDSAFLAFAGAGRETAIEVVFDRTGGSSCVRHPIDAWTARVLERGSAVMLRDARNVGPLRASHAPDGHRSRRSALYVPIRFESDPIGALSVQCHKPNAYSREDLALVEACSVYLTVRLRELRLRSERTRYADLATVDALTGVANRRAFDERLAQEWKRSARSGRPLGLVLVDVDFFKAFNDTYGHPRGDGCLERVAHAMAATL